MTDRALPPGPWLDEIDHDEWLDDATGLRCVLQRVGSLGHLCGYVGVLPDHPTYGASYDALYTGGEDYGPSVHGGLTFNGSTAPSCDTQGLWWFGFDCAHSGDLTPGMLRYSAPAPGEIYRGVDFVRAECARLARQLQKSWAVGPALPLPAAGPVRDRLVRAMIGAFTPWAMETGASASDMRPHFEAAYNALRLAAKEADDAR